MRILLLGDSIMAGRLPGTKIDAGVGAALFLTPELRQAISGSTAVQWADNVDNRLHQACLTYSDVTVISLLANDAFAALADGVITDAEKIAALAAFGHVIRELRDYHPRILVVLYQDPFFGARPDVAAGVRMMNDAIVAACPSGTELLDLRSILNNPAFYDGVDIHPNQAGYDAVAAEILKRAGQQ